MKKIVLISIVIPVFNNAERLRNCLSVLKQVINSEVQVVIIDDGSTDDSPMVAAEFSNEFENFTFHRIYKNEGVGNARNLGLKLSLGSYLYFLDCDDTVTGNFSDALMSELKSNADLVFTLCKQLPSGGSNSPILDLLTHEPNRGREYLLLSLERFESWPLECWGFFIRREFLIDNQISFEQIRISEDMVFMTWVFSKLDKYSLVHDLVYTHHRTPGSLGKSFSNHDVESWFAAFLGLSNLAKEVSLGSSESRVILNRLRYSFAYVLISFLLIGPLGKKAFLTRVAGSQGMDSLRSLAGVEADQAHAELDIFEKFLDKISINVKKLLNQVGPGKTYLYCYDRLSLGVFEILKSLNFKVDGIIDDHYREVLASAEFGISPLSPAILDEELMENDTVIICHDKHSVFTLKQKQLKSLQQDGLQIIKFTTEDLVGDLPFENLFNQNF